jgi:8-oxo-dGTP pyrophosphatase MutT (NUDIX family)
MVVARRCALRLAYRLLQVYWFLWRPHTRSVKCVVHSGGRVLLVRHTYGNRRMWRLPGGGIKRGEAAADAARRELGEELGAQIAQVDPRQVIYDKEYASTTYHCFDVELRSARLAVNRAEIAEVSWFDPDALPHPRETIAAALLERRRDTS